MKGSIALSALILWGGGTAAHGAGIPPGTVTVHEEQVDIPTYRMGPPEANPMFFFGKQSQGAEGRIYPYPLYDNLTEEKTERKYRIIYLENEYIKVGILPEIGGRVLSAVDKTNQYEFVYHQHVIKPALIGLIGAWMSGGIEWNIPHHHRATSFLPVQSRIQENPDGSATVWVGELELRQQMRWAVGYTLHPGRSDLEAKVRIINRTPVAHSMLAFANLAVAADDAYQIIFPPNTRRVTYHSKREFATWPIATSRFNGVDFSRGVDVSWYRNHPEPNSMFAWDTEGDFFAGYDHARDAGTMSIADHTLAPGKKFFTWGNGTTGQLWSGILTDHDGPYLELMTGAYSDNQPDYSWMQPYETREYSQYWYPFRAIGGVKNANLAAAVNLEAKDGWIALGFSTTARHEHAVVRLTQGTRTVLTETITIDPGRPYTKRVKLPAGEGNVRAALLTGGRELAAYAAPDAAEAARSAPGEMPPTYVPPPLPAAVASNEQLYLDGLRIEQFHNPALNPDDYWEEALRRDAGDARVNVALGREMLGRYRYADAERYFRTAVARLGANYTRSKDTEPLYYWGVALRAEGNEVAAARVLADAAWSQEWRAPADFALAEVACRRGDFAAAADLAQRSLDANALNVRALTLRAAALRRLARDDEAARCLQSAALIDPLDVRSATEQWLLSKSSGWPDELRRSLEENPGAALEVAAELDAAGLWSEENQFLVRYVASAARREGFSPLAWYFLADSQDRLGHPYQASLSRRQGASALIAGVFPFQPQAIPLLRRAIAADPTDAKAPYYLGELLFDGQPDEAVVLWEKSAALEPNNPLVLRNLAVAYSHRAGGDNLARAIRWLERAVALPHPAAVHFFELDQLYERAGTAPEKRLALLAANREAVSRRDDAVARLVNLEIACGQSDDAIQILERRTFNIWEGYTAFDTATSWIDAHVARGRQRLEQGNASGALADFEAASQFPPNLRVDLGSPAVRRLAEIGYWQAMAEEGLGARAEAQVCWQRAADAPLPPESSPRRIEQEEYRAKARQKLGRT